MLGVYFDFKLYTVSRYLLKLESYKHKLGNVGNFGRFSNFSEDCYQFSYDKLIKTDEVDDEGQQITSGFTSEITFKLDGVEQCSFPAVDDPGYRREQEKTFVALMPVFKFNQAIIQGL